MTNLLSISSKNLWTCVVGFLLALILILLFNHFGWTETIVGEVGDWFARQTGQQGPVVPPYNP